MGIEVTCSQGHVFQLEDGSANTQLRCPECGTHIVMSELMQDAPQKSRGLWQVMKTEGQPPASAESPASVESSESSQSGADDSSGEESSSETSPKGLWSLMGTPPSDVSTTHDEPPSPAATPNEASPREDEVPSTERHTASDETGGKGLWSVMATDGDAPQSSSEQTAGKAVDQALSPAENHAGLQDVDLGEDEPRGDFDESDDVEAGSSHDAALDVAARNNIFGLGDEPHIPALARIERRTGRSQRAILSLSLGVLAIPLSALAMRSEVWTKFPATLLGFPALVVGLLAVGEINRSRGRQTGKLLAICGIVLGVTAMFLGPMLFSRLGKNLRQTSGRALTRASLEQIGSALSEFHDNSGHFPPGGTYAFDANGEELPMHSWMTMLLPYLGQENLYGTIDLESPFDAAVNLPAMREDVPAFFAVGSEQMKSPRGLGVSHFAGLGGEILNDEIGLAHVGVFGKNSEVTREDISDGLSQTLVAGEVASGFRPWGEPGNWRTIGKGLNKDLSGFGNAAGTGAMFLRADGSVRFFSNKVSPRVLERLSTRDGGEFVDEQYR